ncbi:MAG: branched-chain amino acid ABC transporter permease [Pseudothermotoga sp.]|uniref:branched-chain amino acid ABC transporter permease n=1 Tax=Pseudothermotoga sp. TaxID=2033661 RepID=UPI002588AC27|nr:branched-chain amino acid ABC transporter permease [Pseudothermotoga sp.]MDI6863605.1 branched-chain amino acid ABC transporter permease [Pseudothermotoga sp.]
MKKNFVGYAVLAIALFLIALLRPYAFFYGVQRGSLYGLVALPLALILGIVGLLNLAHGEFLTLSLYMTYLLFNEWGMDPLSSPVLTVPLLLVVGLLIYKLVIERSLKTHHLNLLLLTFGVSIVMVESFNIWWTSRPRNIYVPYASTPLNIFGVYVGGYEFSYTIAVVLVLAGLLLFLKKTRLGQATYAVGQNPKGAAIVGINVKFVYAFVFSLAAGLVALAGALLSVRSSIFPHVGGPFTMKSFSLTAMAGLGNLPGIVLAGIVLGIAEEFVKSIPGYTGWADLVFFVVLIAAIVFRAFGRREG